MGTIGEMKREAERDFHKFIKYVAELEKENKELKKKDKHLERLMAHIMEKENICYVDDGEYGRQIKE